MKRLVRHAAIVLLMTCGPLAAQPVQPMKPNPPPETAAPYDARLARLSEVLGALSYLRPLCGVTGEDWRDDMQKIIDADAANEPERRARMTAAFNRGYRAFASLHTRCSPASRAAERLYRDEAATLVAEITSRFGN